MKIPKDEVVKFVVKSVLHRRTARSQHELIDMVNAELRKVDPEYAIAGKRLRDIVVRMPEVEMRVEIKKGGIPNKCPACGSGLKKVYNRNLKGKKILEYLKCAKCGYVGHDQKWAPRKYQFWVGKKS
jgi:predicted RNA-binding Zn-ribbon protein involved in translation (DUF1610 family)